MAATATSRVVAQGLAWDHDLLVVKAWERAKVAAMVVAKGWDHVKVVVGVAGLEAVVELIVEAVVANPTPMSVALVASNHIGWMPALRLRKQAIDADVILPRIMTGDDAEIIQAVLGGDVDRYAQLVEKYHRFAIRIAFSFLGNYEDAKEASQEAFVSAYRALARFRQGAAFSTWLYRIVINECKDTYRRSARQPVMVPISGSSAELDASTNLFVTDVEEAGADPRHQLSNRELSQQLSRSIIRLPRQQRTAFLLHHVHGLPLDQVAEVMGCRVGTVKSHLFRATTSLKTQLTPWLAQEGR